MARHRNNETAAKKYGRRYPWDRWLGKDPDLIPFVVTMHRGRDFDCRADTFVQMVRQGARRLGRRVMVTMSDAGDRVHVTVVGNR